MTKLLVSVRSVEEAANALAGGAALIDVKEPLLGSLGRAEDAVITQVLQVVAGRVPVSAALGELLEENPPYAGTGLTFVKWGLAGCGRVLNWSTLFARQQASTRDCETVLVAYADWQCCQAPPLHDVIDLACQSPGSILLVDTCCKTPSPSNLKRRSTLLDWLPAQEAINLCRRCRAAQVRVALAGSLSLAEIGLLRTAEPDWFAVRGAVCFAEDRIGMVEENRVRQLARWLA